MKLNLTRNYGALLLIGLMFCNTDQSAQAQSATTAPAQPTAPVPKRRAPLVNAKNNSAAANVVKPAEEKSPIRGSYTFEYEGARLGQPLQETTDPTGAIGSATIGHDARVGYAFGSGQVIGVRGVISQNLLSVNPDGSQNETFVARDMRIYYQWAKLIETSDLEMTGVFDFVFSTSDSSQKKEKIFQLNIKNNWVLKTSARNWFFSAVTAVSPRWYKNPYTAADFTIALYPWVTVDLATDWQLLFEGSFDAAHPYTANFFDYVEGDPDYINIGPLVTLNANIQINPALRFYTTHLSFKTATLYFNFTAAL